MLGLLAVVAFVSWFLPHVANAAQSDAVDPMSTVNAVNTAWTLMAAFLVFGMQVGFVMLESGFARERESVNILVEGIADTCICGVLFWAIGFAFMFEDGTPLIGTHGFFLQGLPETYGTTGVPLLAFWVFQFAFADTASTITSGAMVGRCGFIGDMLYSIGVTGFIYPIIGHWAWGPDGWLAANSFHDFAGSTVVHTIGGTISLAGAIALGPRLGRVFKRDGGGPMPPHNIILGAVGGLILWFGWYGFNPGSTLSALDASGIGRVSFNTTLAACSAGLTGLFISYFRGGKWDLGMTTNGFLAGLVAITCPCYWVDPIGAFFIGIIGAVVMVCATDLLEYLRIDDPIGAVPVHMAAGMAGHDVARVCSPRASTVHHRRRAPTPPGGHRAVLRRRRDAAMDPGIRHGHRRAGGVRRIDWADVRGQGNGHAARLPGGRARRSRHSRARCAGLPGVRYHLRHGDRRGSQPEWLGRHPVGVQWGCSRLGRIGQLTDKRTWTLASAGTALGSTSCSRKSSSGVVAPIHKWPLDRAPAAVRIDRVMSFACRCPRKQASSLHVVLVLRATASDAMPSLWDAVAQTISHEACSKKFEAGRVLALVPAPSSVEVVDVATRVENWHRRLSAGRPHLRGTERHPRRASRYQARTGGGAASPDPGRTLARARPG